jgi:hypothetical protein
LAGGYPIYIVSTDFGCINRNQLQAAKRLIGITVNHLGEVRTERGGKPIGDMNRESLGTIVASPEAQKAFRAKLEGCADFEAEPRLRIISRMETEGRT